MPHHFRAYQPDQPLLLPPDLRHWLPEDHLVYTVNELVDALDLAAFLRALRAAGLRESAVCTRHDGEDPGLRLCHGGIVVLATGAETGGGCGLPGAGGGESTATSHPL